MIYYLEKETTMLVKACDAVDIFELNRRKEYTLTATCILESVLTNPSLTAQTVKLWQFLFNKARFHSNLEVRICYNELGKNLHRSSRSVSRYIRTLVQEGYLLVDENFSKNGSQQSNTLYVRIPSMVVEEVKNKKDRIVNKGFFSPKDEQISSAGDTAISSYEKPDAHSSVEHASTPISSQPYEENLTNHLIRVFPSDKIDVGEDDKIDVHKDNTKKDLLISNNIVVTSFHNAIEKSRIFELTNEDNVINIIQNDRNVLLRETQPDLQDIQDQKEIDELGSEINLLFIKMGKIAGIEKIVIFDKIRQLQETVSSISVIMSQRKQSKQLIHSKTNMVGTIAHLVDPSMDFSKATGERELSIMEITRIRKAVEKSPKYLNDTKRICNEIVYATRFGALRIAQNGDTLSVPHAISIAIKLLREGRWETPTPMKRKDKQASFQDKNHQQWASRGHQYIGSSLQNMNTCVHQV
jgi:hypothetical protein